MPAQPALSARAVPPDRSPLGWLILLPLAGLVLARTPLAWTGVTPVFDGALADPDSYMRLNRVRALHEGGAWFDPRDLRINPPEGHVQHWTRPLDAVLSAGGFALGLRYVYFAALGEGEGHVHSVILRALLIGMGLLTLQQAGRVESAAPRAPTRGRARAAAAADATWS